MDTAASADVSTGSADAASAPAAESITGLVVGAELLCEPFETGSAVIGTVTAIDGDDVVLTLADFGTTWPVDLDCIDVAAGTWEHAPEDYPAPGNEPSWDVGHRPWLAPKPADTVAAAEAPTEDAEAIAKLAALVAPLVGEDGAPVDVPLAGTLPQDATPEPIAPLATPYEYITKAPANVDIMLDVDAAEVLHELVEELASAALVVPLAAPVLNHPGPGWVLCRVNGPGTIAGSWIRQDTGQHHSVARINDVGFFTEATLAKFERIGHGDLLTRL